MPSGAGTSSAPASAEVLEMAEPSKTEQRKAEHVNIILQENVSAEYNYWNGVRLVFANLGAPQLVPQEGKRAYGVADARKAMQMIKADALIVHLNFLQEVVQPEGDRRAKGCLAAIKALASKFPLMAKETGAGISR